MQYPIGSAVKHMTMQVDIAGLRVFRLRVWLGMKLIALAAWVIGCSVKVER